MKTETPASHPHGQNGFLFLGNQLALDFLNTRPVQNGEPVELLADFRTLLGWFKAAGLLSSHQAVAVQRRWGNSGAARRTLRTLLNLREKLRGEILAWESGEPIGRTTVEELNNLLAEHPMRTRLKAHGDAYAEELWFEVRRPEDMVAPLAHAAATLLANVDRNRVRKCEQCVLHFQDTSKKGTRRWCSMQLCGNRVKVAAYAARQRSARRVKRSRKLL
jgi:predicted RNA-binding Zn ribbon-like protein